MSDKIRGDRLKESYYGFQSLQYSLFVTLFITILGGGFFLICSLYVVQDKKDADAATKGKIGAYLHRLLSTISLQPTYFSILELFFGVFSYCLLTSRLASKYIYYGPTTS